MSCVARRRGGSGGIFAMWWPIISSFFLVSAAFGKSLGHGAGFRAASVKGCGGPEQMEELLLQAVLHHLDLPQNLKDNSQSKFVILHVKKNF